jgi:DNA-binding transcriptional MocR family regulator
MRSPRLFDIDNATRDPQDHFGHTLSNGSFSKVLAPGLRTGWVEATPALVDQLSQAGATVSGGAPSQFCAALISNLFASRDFDQHLHTRVRPSLAARHSLLQTSIDQHLLHLGVKCVRSSQAEKNIFGGYFAWIELPSGISASQVAELCAHKMNLSVLPGHLCEVAGDEDSARYGHFIRLCFAWESKSNLSEGVRRLASVIRALLNA